METKQIIYLVAFALILRIVYRLVMRIRKEKSGTADNEDTE